MHKKDWKDMFDNSKKVFSKKKEREGKENEWLAKKIKKNHSSSHLSGKRFVLIAILDLGRNSVCSDHSDDLAHHGLALEEGGQRLELVKWTLEKLFAKNKNGDQTYGKAFFIINIFMKTPLLLFNVLIHLTSFWQLKGFIIWRFYRR